MSPYWPKKVAGRGYRDGATFGFAEQTKGSERPKPEPTERMGDTQ
ncbi:hypothetical protein QUF95_16110 [Paenibacillus silvae]|nr:hypothetical protein [Paenibacillus silvae]MDM5278924.1 hypothetical protein [Paenibacillus silvae]